MQHARQIGQGMFAYARDHNGAYPTGRSSTEVFQKLIDGGYVSDSSLFWEGSGILKFPGKLKATSKTLRPENVCWDVTVSVDDNSSDFLPLVFLTGYKINYFPGGTAEPLFPWAKDFTGLVVYYKGYNLTFLQNDGQPDGTVNGLISPNYADNKKYQQLTPEGPLEP